MDHPTIGEYMSTVNQILDAQSNAISALTKRLERQQECLRTLEQRYQNLAEMPEILVHQVPAINQDRLDYEMERDARFDFGKVLNEEPRSRKLTVSLTSFPRRMHELQYMLYSLTKQTLRPDRIVLWLSDEEFPRREDDIAPSLLDKIRQWQITLRWTSNEKSYKKLLPTLKAYPEDLIVTADDDLFYRPDWLEVLYQEYQEHGNITAHRVKRVLLDEKGEIAAADKWPYAEKGSLAYSNEGTTGGGVLFFPGCFHADVLDAEKYLYFCPTEDELWFWAMAVLGGQRTKATSGSNQDTICVNPLREFSPDPAEHLMAANIFHGGTERQLRQLFKEYPQITEILREEMSEMKRKEAAFG